LKLPNTGTRQQDPKIALTQDEIQGAEDALVIVSNQ
jgi:hypothetical protein